MLGIIFATAAAVLTIVLAVYAYLYRKRHAKNALNAGYEDGSEGLFSGWDASLYTLFCKGDPECAVRKLGVDKAVFLEMESSMLTILDIEKEIAWIKTTDQPYLIIEARINELMKRKAVIFESVKDLITL